MFHANVVTRSAYGDHLFHERGHPSHAIVVTEFALVVAFRATVVGGLSVVVTGFTSAGTRWKGWRPSRAVR